MSDHSKMSSCHIPGYSYMSNSSTLRFDNQLKSKNFCCFLSQSVRIVLMVRTGQRWTWKDVKSRPRVREAPCLTLKSFLHGQKRLRLFIPIIELPLITAVINFHLDTILTSKAATWTLNSHIRICSGILWAISASF